MFITSRTTILLVLGSVLGSIVDATTVEVPARTNVANSLITTPPSLSLKKIERRVTSAVTCSEWVVVDNGPANWFTCGGGVNTCILGSSTPYWHCGDSQATQTWYTSCYDFGLSSQSGNNNYCPQNRPYCGTWSIITDQKTYSTFGCDTTKADKTLVRRSTTTVTAQYTVTAYVQRPEGADESGGIESQNTDGSTTWHLNGAAEVAVSLASVGSAALIGVVVWLYVKKMRKDRDLTRGSVVMLGKEIDRLSEEEKLPVVKVREVSGDDI